MLRRRFKVSFSRAVNLDISLVIVAVSIIWSPHLGSYLRLMLFSHVLEIGWPKC